MCLESYLIIKCDSQPISKKAIDKANNYLNTIKVMRKYFNATKLIKLITSNFYSILYYISEVWLIHSLKQYDKNLFLTASASALKLANHYRDAMVSYYNLHRKLNRASPDMHNYKLALMLYETHNGCLPESEWIALNFSQTLMSKENYFHVNKSNYNLVGLNILGNRFHNLNDKIPLE
jgi:hypothetical protein